MKLAVIPGEEWKKLSEAAHAVCFKEKRSPEFDRFDYAVFVEDSEGEPLGYATIRELDSESCYMKHGGAFPAVKDTARAYPVYEKMISFLKNKYKNISTLIENENVVMIKFAMKAGLRATGVRVFRGEIYVEHSFNRKEAE